MAEVLSEPFVLGTSHVVAEAGVRTRLHFDPDAVEALAARLVGRGILDEALPLGTCGRLELYATAADPERAARVLRHLLHRHRGLPRDLIEAHTFRRTGDDAVRHAFRVASGLDSVVHGEAQILGQVRAALRRARAAAITGSVTERLFERALATGKRVRTETDIGRGTASLAGAALQLLRARAGSLRGRSALVIGAGETGALMARLLQKAGVGELVVANRTVARARSVAGPLGGHGVGLDRIPERLAGADLVIGAVSGVEKVLGPDHFAHVADGRRRWLFDLSHPRAFDPAVAELPGVELMDLDRLSREVEDARAERRRQVPAAEAIVESEVAAFRAWLRRRLATPVLRGLREQVLERAHREAERLARGRSSEARQEVHRLARRVARSLLHGPTVALRDADPTTDEGRALLEAARSLFAVPPGGEAR